MTIDIANESGVECDERSLVEQAAFALNRLRIHPQAELSMILVDEDAMTVLHEQWMNEPGPTDVLSFPMDELRPEVSEPVEGHLGDIVVCPQVAKKQAKVAGHSFRTEMGVLITHGILHLLGYDHAEPEEERLMFGLQGQLVAEWRHENPGDDDEPELDEDAEVDKEAATEAGIDSAIVPKTALSDPMVHPRQEPNVS